MSCEHLVCARCAGPVVEGRCPTCRVARSQIHHSHLAGLPPALIMGLLLVAFAMLVALNLSG